MSYDSPNMNTRKYCSLEYHKYIIIIFYNLTHIILIVVLNIFLLFLQLKDDILYKKRNKQFSIY